MKTLEFHPAANVFPLLSDDALAALVEDIRTSGQKQPIVLHPDGTVLDGRNRARAMAKLDRHPETTTWRPEGKGDMPEALAYVISLNLRRRSLTAVQRACVAVKALGDELGWEARARRKSSGRVNKKHRTKLSDAGPNWWDDQATRFQTSKGYLVTAARLWWGERAPAKSGESSPGQDREAFDRAWQGLEEFQEIKRRKATAAKEARTAENRGKLGETKPEEGLEGLVRSGVRFGTITLDPPWDYSPTPAGSGDLGEPDYEVMKLDEIAKLPVRQLCDPDCHVFCWTTFRFLEATIALFKGGTVRQKAGELRLAGWGIRPIALLTWWKRWVDGDGNVKHPLGLGSHFRWDAEYVLVGTVGNPDMLTRKQGVVFEGEPREHRHSAKPLAFYDIVEGCSRGPYLEFFARSGREGWTSYGQEGVTRA